MRHCHSISLAVVLIAITGCNSGGSADSGGQSEMDRMAQMLEQESATKQQAAVDVNAEGKTDEQEIMPTAEPVRITESNQNREETANPLLAAAHARAYVANNAINIQHRKAIDHFHGLNGYYPKSHEEYMKKIVDAGLMILPDAEEGYEFWYNPEDPLNIYVRAIGSGENAEGSS